MVFNMNTISGATLFLEQRCAGMLPKGTLAPKGIEVATARAPLYIKSLISTTNGSNLNGRHAIRSVTDICA